MYHLHSKWSLQIKKSDVLNLHDCFAKSVDLCHIYNNKYLDPLLHLFWIVMELRVEVIML